MINHGVKLGRRDTDYVAGTLYWENRNPSGDWTAFLPPGEWQRILVPPYTDFMDCVTESLQNSVETQEKFLTNEQHDYSGRWSAKRNGTTKQGNWLWKVADQARQEGMILEVHYPDIISGTWEEQYAEIPEPLASQFLAEGKDWLNKWQIQYEWVAVSKQSFLHELQHAPLQIVIPGHAIVAFYCPGDVVKYFDTYDPFIKESNYGDIQDALKIVLTPKTMSNVQFVHKINTSEYGFYVPAMTEDALKDKAKNFGLNILKDDGTIDFDKARNIEGL